MPTSTSSATASPKRKRNPQDSKKAPPTKNGKTTAVSKARTARSAASKRAVIDDSSDEEASEPESKPEPKTKRAKKVKSEPKTVKAATKPKKEPVTKPTKDSVKKEGKAKRAKKEPKEEQQSFDSQEVKEEDEEDEEEKWWQKQPDMDPDANIIKWATLEHNGVQFPPPYEALPDHVHLIYDSKPVKLPLEAEEVAGFFGAMLNSGDHCQNPVFQQNFFNDFLQVLKDSGKATCKATKKEIQIKDFDKCDFTSIFNYYEQQREAKKALPAAEKKRMKEERDKAEEHFKTCMFNGRRENVGNFRIEPPGLFRGRGKHPKTGKLKARVQPEQVTINIGEGVKIPEPPEGHEWGEVRHDRNVSWLAMWKENINGNTKYVFLAQNSTIKGQSDLRKFEKARQLKDHIEAIRADYTKELKSEIMAVRQRATAVYLIDQLALRAGGEKGADEADTVGCCSLRYEHITLEPPNVVHFDFLGKDSIRYQNTTEVSPAVFTNLRIFKKAPKTAGDDIFDRLDPGILNKHLQSYMPGLTAKVFRTYNASHTMQKLLDKIPDEGTPQEKVLKFNAANREVAILCNHQRTVAKGHEQSVQRVQDRIDELMWQKIRALKILLQLDPNAKKANTYGKGFFQDIGALSATELKRVTERIIEKERDKARKKFQKDQEKAEATKNDPEPTKMPTKKDLDEALAKIDELHQKYKQEFKSKVFEVSSATTPEKLVNQINKLEARISNTKIGLQDKQDNSQVSLGTSKMNYIDPRLTVMYSKKYSVPIEKLFTKTLREKFAWAIDSADENWKF